ncbi:MAG: F0F1 ATP synthase subunit A [Cetobacterium sp.]|uniref:F0F1 ATP synthase subunit A n=1 Tax=unclassified Cetobacterium TaxID=2630983 RepID=UPI00163C4ED9|nr:F0F1 ATP synthase subunit A [Cetobacterium sp. 2A]MBC2856389.1 F0F1 ATP synthase subunit A [Cetobacterium sp. 2A]
MRITGIEFFTPPLVEGPAISFFVPLPEFLHQMPFAMQIADGKYGLPVSITVISTWFVLLLLAVLFKLGTKKLEVVPTSRWQALVEELYGFLHGIISQMLGSWWKKYFSFISTLFFFILTSNLLLFIPIPWGSMNNGILTISPAFRTPTADLNTTVGLAMLTTIVFLGTSIKLNGLLGYFKGLFEPLPIMFPINVVGELAKPTNISIRLFGNMFAGSVIMGLIYKAAPAVIPAPLHLYFDIFSGVVQSFVFIMLTMVYIQGSLGDSQYPDEEKLKI